MRWPRVVPLVYLCLCLGMMLPTQMAHGPASERWLTVQGLTLPWGVALSYLPENDQTPELLLAVGYLTAAVVNTCLLSAGQRLIANAIAWLEKLDQDGNI